MDFRRVQLQRLTQAPAYRAVFRMWWTTLLPRWKLLSHTATTPDLLVFVRKVASTGLAPYDFIALSCQELMAKTRLELVNVVTAKSGAEAQRIDWLSPDGPGTNSLVSTGFYVHARRGDLSLRFLDISKPADDAAHGGAGGGVCGASSHAVDILAHAGPEKLLDSEMKFHEAIVLPATVVFTAVYDRVYHRMLDATARDYANEATYTAYLYIENALSYMYMFTIIYGILQIIICSFAKLDDRLSSHYLAVPFFARFADLFVLLFAFVVVGPWEHFVAKIGAAPGFLATTPFMVVDAAFAVSLQLACVIAIVFFYMRMNSAYFPMLVTNEMSDIPGNSGFAQGDLEREVIEEAALLDGYGGTTMTPTEAAAAGGGGGDGCCLCRCEGIGSRCGCGGSCFPTEGIAANARRCAAEWGARQRDRVSRLLEVNSTERAERLAAIGRYRRKASAIDVREELLKEIAIRGYFGGEDQQQLSAARDDVAGEAAAAAQ